MKIEIGKVKAIFTKIKPIRELLRCKLTNKWNMGMMFTCPGIAKPSEKSKNNIIKEESSVIDLSIGFFINAMNYICNLIK